MLAKVVFERLFGMGNGLISVANEEEKKMEGWVDYGNFIGYSTVRGVKEKVVESVPWALEPSTYRQTIEGSRYLGT